MHKTPCKRSSCSVTQVVSVCHFVRFANHISASREHILETCAFTCGAHLCDLPPTLSLTPQKQHKTIASCHSGTLEEIASDGM